MGVGQTERGVRGESCEEVGGAGAEVVFLLSFHSSVTFFYLSSSVSLSSFLSYIYPNTSLRKHPPEGAIKTENRRQNRGPHNTAREETGETKMRYGPGAQKFK